MTSRKPSRQQGAWAHWKTPFERFERAGYIVAPVGERWGLFTGDARGEMIPEMFQGKPIVYDEAKGAMRRVDLRLIAERLGGVQQ